MSKRGGFFMILTIPKGIFMEETVGKGEGFEGEKKVKRKFRQKGLFIEQVPGFTHLGDPSTGLT